MICNNCKKFISAIVLLAFTVNLLSTNVFAVVFPLEESEGDNMSCFFDEPEENPDVPKGDASEKHYDEFTGDSEFSSDSSEEMSPFDLSQKETVAVSEKDEPEDDLNQKETMNKQSLSEFLINLKEKIKEDEPEAKTVMLKDLIDIGSFSGKYYSIKEGSCGDNVKYSFSSSTGKLVISGKGAMYNYSYENQSPWYLYRDCIKSVEIDDGVTNIGEYAFYRHENLRSVTIPDSVASIDDWAFNESRLQEVTIPDSVTFIGNSAFERCVELTSVSIGHGVTEIGYRAFMSCTSLESVTIPENVAKIGSNAFSCCEKLVSVTYLGSNRPECYHSGKGEMFYLSPVNKVMVPIYYNKYEFGGYEIQRDKCATSNKLFGSCGENVNYEFTFSTGELKITGNGEMNDYCYYPHTVSVAPWEIYKDYITSVTIDEGIKKIGNGSFFNCRNLTSVNIPSSIMTIGDFAFSGCSKLVSVDIPDNPYENTCIGESAFYFCYSLESVTVHTNMNLCLGHHAFALCTGLKSFTFYGRDIGSIEGFRHKNTEFSKCYVLNAINVTSYNWRGSLDKAFGKKVIIQDIAIDQEPAQYKGKCGHNVSYYFNCKTGELTIFGTGTMDGYSEYDNYAPWGSYKDDIKSVIIEDGVTDIGNYAFYECYNLKSVKFPNSLKKIGNEAFAYCKGLRSVKIPKGIKEIYSGAFRYSGLKSVEIPKSLKVMGSYVFYGCSCLKSANIRGDISVINDYSFACCEHLKSVTISESVITIGKRAFYECRNLSSIKYNGIIQPEFRGDEVFYCPQHGNTDYFIQTSITVKVPKEYAGSQFGEFRVTKR